MLKDVASFSSPYGSLTRMGLCSVESWDVDAQCYLWTDLLGNHLMTPIVKVILKLDPYGGSAQVSELHHGAFQGGGFAVKFSELWLWKALGSRTYAPWVLSTVPLDIASSEYHYLGSSLLGDYILQPPVGAHPTPLTLSLDTDWWDGWLRDTGGLYQPVGKAVGTRHVGYARYIGSIAKSPTPLAWAWIELRALRNDQPIYKQNSGNYINGAPTNLWWDGRHWIISCTVGAPDADNEGYWEGGAHLGGAFAKHFNKPPSVLDRYTAHWTDPSADYICLTTVITPPVPGGRPNPALPAFRFGNSTVATPAYRMIWSKHPTSKITAYVPNGWKVSLLSDRGAAPGPDVPEAWLSDDLVVQAIYELDVGDASLTFSNYNPNVTYANSNTVVTSGHVWG